MKGAIAIGVAELRHHRLVLWVAPLLGLLPLVGHFLVHRAPLRPAQPGETQFNAGGLVWVLAYVLSAAIAVGLGSEAFSRDIRERRLAFWLSRPLSLFQYWAGKLATAWLLAVAAAALVMLPAHLLGALSWAETADTLGKAIGWRNWTLLLALLVAGANVASGFFIVRSPLLALDIVMLPVLWAIAGLALGQTVQMGTGRIVSETGLPWVARGAVLVLLAASAVQICVGRLDMARGRRWLSGITWVGLLSLVTGGILGFGHYVAAEAPTDLHLAWVDVDAPPGGRHVLLGGTSSRWWGHHFGYVLDERGQSHAIGDGDGLSGWAWSRDGRRIAWSREGLFSEESGARPPAFFGLGPAVTLLDLEAPGREAERLALQESGSVVDFSPSGQRLLLLGPTKRVVDAATGAELATLQDPIQWHQAAFVSETMVRALRQGPLEGVGNLDGDVTEWAFVVEWDLSSGRVAERGSVALQGAMAWTVLKPVESWQKLLRLDRRGLSLLDLDGSVIVELAGGWPAVAPRMAGRLSGGRYGLIEEEDSELRFRVFDAEGAAVCDARLPGFPVRVGGEPAANMLAVAVTPQRGAGAGPLVTLLVDLATAEIERREVDAYPALAGWGWRGFFGRVHTEPEPGSLATRLFLGDDGLVTIDPATGARTVLVRRNRLGER
jgi:hypothetical protein